MSFKKIIGFGNNFKHFHYLFISIAYQWSIVIPIYNMPNNFELEKLAMYKNI